MSKLKKLNLCCACSNVKPSTTSFHSWHSSVSLVPCIKTVPAQFVHKKGLSFSSIWHLSSPLRTGKPVGLITMGIWNFWYGFPKKSGCWMPGLWNVSCWDSGQGSLVDFCQPSLKFSNSPTHLSHVLVSE